MSNFNIKVDNIQINKARIKLKVAQYDSYKEVKIRSL